MSAPIIRTGPFINTITNRPANQPTTADDNVIPVNCALSDWSDDGWKAFAYNRVTRSGWPPVTFDRTTREYEDGPSITLETSNGIRTAFRSDVSGQLRLIFYYQAAKEFNLQVDALTFAITGGAGNSAFVSFNIAVGGNTVFDEVDSATANSFFDVVEPTISFDGQITLPASVVPNPVEFNMFCRTIRGGSAGSDALATITISPPAT